ncbi:MAG: T9SS type A sorting domain-containing protein [Bacteroidota bacterium]|nr:T9SS type A sorting domain-containing protein [Bacteroidota bacterium]
MGSTTGRLWRSTDQGNAWLTTPGYLSTTSGTYTLASDGTTMYASRVTEKITKSTDNGVTWNQVNNGIPAGYNPALFSSFNFLQAQEVQRVYESQRLHEGMEGLGNNLGNATPRSKPLDQQPPLPSTGWTRPATPLKIAATFVVTTIADTGAGSLRAAITLSNGTPGLDLISFNIAGGGVQTITPITSLPQLNDPVIIDGTTQPGFSGTPIIELNGGSAPLGTNGLNLVGGNSIVRGLVINRFKRFTGGGNGYAIVLDVNGSNFIQGNYIGLNAAGTAILPNGNSVGIFGTSGGNTIGGTTPETRNVVSGNLGAGVAIATGSIGGNIVKGNYIGTDATGTTALGNGGNGIFSNAPNNIIGGLVSGAGNIVADNALPGIFIGASANGTVVQGNYVGTDVTGSFNLGNRSNGINVRSSDNIIGDISPTGRNIIAGSSSAGIYFFGPTATRNRVINNLIGTDVSGTVAFANNKGMVFDNAHNNTVGGETAEEGNLIAGNLGHGVDILNAGATGNKLLNNFIGTNWNAQSDLGNSSHGIKVASSQDTIKFNTIAYNSEVGVFIAGGIQNMIRENSIYSNGGMAIDLAPAGLTINDSLDNDTGPNNLQNFPILVSARVQQDSAIVYIKLESKPSAQFQIDFYANEDYDVSHFGEGARWLHREFVFTDNQGYVATTLLLIVGSENYITATATDAEGNTSEFSQALCLLDSDGDGIMDSWEMSGWGIDVNSDGIIDQDLNAMGASPYYKDIFVEVDAMTGMAPHDSSLQKVADAFAAAGNGGIYLHVTKSDIDIFPIPWLINWWEGFHDVKSAYFGTQAERTSPNARFILEAKKLVYRYCIFASQHTTDSWSGRAEDNFRQGCDDFMVTLGGWTPSGGSEDQKAGTFMHELGHTLGLRHGGGDGKQYKPNYISIMNYTWQMPFSRGLPWRLDYSREALPTLNETNLDEFAGLNVPVGSLYDDIIAVPYSGPGHGLMYAKLKPNTPVDWDSSGTIDTLFVISADINIFADTSRSPGELLVSQDDWSQLVYSFRNSPDFSDASRSNLRQGLDEMKELDFETFQFLNNLPPPKPSGEFVMDGVLDTSAVPIASNAGINLYARYKSGQLYVATNSAQSQGADMFIFISDGRNSLRAAPSGKNGQVSAWSVFLWNNSSDNSTGWSNATEGAQNNFTADTVGTVLEGVIDIEYLYGKSPSALFIAVGKYGTNASGVLLAQVPVGNGDGNIDPSELFWFIGAPPPLNTYFTQQGAKLVGTGAVGSPVFQGYDVALSSDGNTAIIGGFYDNSNTGAAWVYTRSGGVWSQQGSKLIGAGAAGVSGQGHSVSLSGDGNTAIVGGPFDGGGGAAWVFTRSGGVWSQQGNKLVGTAPFGYFLGCSVSLSDDGNTAIIGEFRADGDAGAVWVFTRTAGVWSQQGDKLVGTGAVGNAQQGYSASLSGDGNTAIIGGRFDNGEAGAAWVFTRSAGVWTQQGDKLVGTGAVGRVFQGSDVALSSDGNTAIIGGPTDNSNTGAAWVFTRSAGVWTQQGSKLVGTGAVGIAQQGSSVSLSGDGNTALVGGQADNGNVGATWVFTRSGGNWIEQVGKMVGTGTAGANQGWSVALSSDGNTAIVGGPIDATGLGAAWVFMHDTPLSVQLASFTATIVNVVNVRLDWTTTSEYNNLGFEIQRSPDNQNNFSTIPNSFIPGYGTTSEPHSYFYIDTTAGVGIWYFRLKQIDVDSSIHYTAPIQAVISSIGEEAAIPVEFALYQNYPNPFNPSTTFRYDLPNTAYITLSVYNVLGQKIETLYNGERKAGTYKTTWNASRLPSGIYFVRIQAASYVATKKVVLMK